MEGIDIPYFQLSSGFIIGLAIGFFIKKSIKIALFIFALALLTIFGAQYLGIVTINQEGLEHLVVNGAEATKTAVFSLKDKLVSMSAGGASAAVGFLAGLKIG